MKITYDRRANAAYVYMKDKIKKGESVRQHIFNNRVILDVDKAGQILGIEILDCTEPKVKDITASIAKTKTALCQQTQ